MKTIILSLFFFAVFAVGINAQNCTTDADCTTGSLNACCFNAYFNKGSCYDNTVNVCTTCYCEGGCAGLENQLCSIAEFSADAECCVDKCVNPNTDECCSYHLPHSTQGTSSVCALSDTGACCGANCYDTATEQCCIYQTGDTQYYTTGKDRVCCGFYGSCDAATQICNGSTPNYNGVCVNKTSTTPTGPSDDGDNTEGCNDQACCDAQANPNPQTGSGYLQYAESCKQGGQDCVGNSGCQLCFNADSGAENFGDRAVCNFGNNGGDDDGNNGGSDNNNDNGCNDQACCNAQANPNPQSGDGYLEYDENCKQGGQNCVGNSGCKLCFGGAVGVANLTGRPICSFAAQTR